MNSEQLLLLVASLGFVTVVIVTSLGAKNKKQQSPAAPTSPAANRAHRRKPGKAAGKRA